MSAAKQISATVIAQNEAANLPDCLTSLAFLDEVVVVDGGSTDETEQVCRSFDNVRYFSNPWVGYGVQKNRAAALATHDWILNIDADERVSDKLRKEIEALDLTGAAADVFTVKRLNHICGRPVRSCGLYPDRQKRLYHRKRTQFSEPKVHEAVTGRIVRHLQHHLIHYTYDDLDDFCQRSNHYSSLAAEQMIADGRTANVFDICLRPIFKFGKMYLVKGGITEGIMGLTLSVLYAYYTFLKYLKASGLFGRGDS